MNFTIEKKHLQAGLNAIKNGLNKKDPTSPFATNIQIVAKGGQVSLIATNGETHYSWTSPDGVLIDEEGSIAANAEKLFSSANHLPDEKVCFTLNSNLLNVQSGKMSMELKTIGDKNFGTVDQITAPISLKGDTTSMFKRILHTLNRDPAKPRMLGLLMDFKSDGDAKTVVLKSVSPTRASRYHAEFESGEPVNTQLILPCFLVDEAAKHNLVKLGIEKGHMVAVFNNNLTVSTPLHENVFVNPDQVFDAKDTWHGIKFKREDLDKAIRAVLSVCDKQDKKARISATDDGTVEVSSYSNSEKFRCSVSASYENENKPNFALNSEHLSELLTSLDGEDIELNVGARLMTFATPEYKYVTSLYNQG